MIVNRLWQHHMGRGIVATPSDFGAQGERPTHPELLDYLAGELIANGWRLKPIHKLIMTSAVYMQSTALGRGAGGGGSREHAVLAAAGDAAGGRGDPRLDARRQRPARSDDVRPRHAGRVDAAAEHLLLVKRAS